MAFSKNMDDLAAFQFVVSSFVFWDGGLVVSGFWYWRSIVSTLCLGGQFISFSVSGFDLFVSGFWSFWGGGLAVILFMSFVFVSGLGRVLFYLGLFVAGLSHAAVFGEGGCLFCSQFMSCLLEAYNPPGSSFCCSFKFMLDWSIRVHCLQTQALVALDHTIRLLSGLL